MSVIMNDGEAKYHGVTLGTGTSYLYDGIYTHHAIVWDADLEEIKHIGVGSNYNGDGSGTGYDKVTIDATPDIYNLVIAVAADTHRAIALNNYLKESSIITHGKTVEVFKGRKVPKGTTGKVFWIGNNGWGESVGLDTDDGRVFTAIGNVRLVGSEIMDDRDWNVAFDMAESAGWYDAVKSWSRAAEEAKLHIGGRHHG